jgi:hypothetical protein
MKYMDQIQSRLPGLELILQGIFIIITIWLLVGSFFLNSEASKLFPQLTAGIVSILFILFFISKAVPGKLLNRLPEQNTLTYGGDETTSNEFDEGKVAMVFIMFGVFIIGVYLFGLLIAVPAYVYANLYYFEYGDRRRKFKIVIIAFIIVAISYDVFRIQLTQGIIFDAIF